MLNVQFVADPNKTKDEFAKKGVFDISEKMLQEAATFKDEVEKKWKDKEVQISAAFEDMTGIPLQGEFRVSVVHPNLEIGHYHDEKNLDWGHRDLYPNYIVIGITHELLHCLTHQFYESLDDDNK